MLIKNADDVKEIKVSTQARLAALGFTTAAKRITKLAEKSRKMAIAYEHYRFVRPENIDRFNKKLRDETFKQVSRYQTQYQTLAFTPIGEFQEIPPTHVLENLETATSRHCFDSFEVAHIVSVKDPILFGRINECPDLFFIDQWDDDVKIEDILKENEG